MRERLFRGKRIDTGEWVYGAYLAHDHDGHTIFNQNLGDGSLQGFEVIPETVGQDTGLKDRNGVEIWEGDVHEYKRSYFVIKFGYYTDDDTHTEMYGWYFDSNTLEEQGSLGVGAEKYVNIVGNVCENPEFYGMRQLFLTRHENNR